MALSSPLISEEHLVKGVAPELDINRAGKITFKFSSTFNFHWFIDSSSWNHQKFYQDRNQRTFFCVGFRVEHFQHSLASLVFYFGGGTQLFVMQPYGTYCILFHKIVVFNICSHFKCNYILIYPFTDVFLNDVRCLCPSVMCKSTSKTDSRNIFYHI